MDLDWSAYCTSLHGLVSGGGISYTRSSTVSNKHPAHLRDLPVTNQLCQVLDLILPIQARIHLPAFLAPGPQRAVCSHQVLKMQLIDLYPDDSVPLELSGYSREDHCLNAGG